MATLRIEEEKSSELMSPLSSSMPLPSSTSSVTKSHTPTCTDKNSRSLLCALEPRAKLKFLPMKTRELRLEKTFTNLYLARTTGPLSFQRILLLTELPRHKFSLLMRSWPILRLTSLAVDLWPFVDLDVSSESLMIIETDRST
jgi:hypothetical protein